MIEKIKQLYGDFHDALITEVNYFNGYNFDDNVLEETVLTVKISCYNLSRPYGSRELIEIQFKNVEKFIYEKTEGAIFETMIKEEDGKIITDFFYENDHPYFFVVCERISYAVLKQN